MKALIYICTAAILFTAASCKKETAKPSIEEKLIGKWKFERITLGTGVVYVAVPSQVDVIEFKQDHNFQRSTNGEAGAHGTYETKHIKSIYTLKEDDALKLSTETTDYIISIKKDTLYMIQNSYDGSGSVFSRVK